MSAVATHINDDIVEQQTNSIVRINTYVRTCDVFNKDSRNMSELKDQSVHLVVTSPPYPGKGSWKCFEGMDFGEMHNYLEQTWKECYRVLANGGHLVINIFDVPQKGTPDKPWYILNNTSEVINRCIKLGFVQRTTIYWRKKTSFGNYRVMTPNADSAFNLDLEHILVFFKPPMRVFPPKDPRRVNVKALPQELTISQVWDIQNKPGGRTFYSFPEEVPKRFIQLLTIEGDTVLDPFVGTGTTIKVAQDLGRNGVGYEINPSLIPMIKDRLSGGTDYLKAMSFGVKQRRMMGRPQSNSKEVENMDSAKAGEIREGVAQAVETVKKSARKLTISLTHSKSGDYTIISTDIVRQIFKAAGLDFGKLEAISVETVQDIAGELKAVLRLKPADESA